MKSQTVQLSPIQWYTNIYLIHNGHSQFALAPASSTNLPSNNTNILLHISTENITGIKYQYCYVKGDDDECLGGEYKIPPWLLQSPPRSPPRSLVLPPAPAFLTLSKESRDLLTSPWQAVAPPSPPPLQHGGMGADHASLMQCGIYTGTPEPAAGRRMPQVRERGPAREVTQTCGIWISHFYIKGRLIQHFWMHIYPVNVEFFFSREYLPCFDDITIYFLP